MKKMIVCNHKMNLSTCESRLLNDALLKLDISSIDLIICPNYLDFDIYSNFELCAQDAYYENKGPYTSKISAYMLKEKGINYSLVGHSYLRQFDSNKVINKKVLALANNNMIPILCVGDTKEDYLKNETIKVIKKQLKKALKNVSLDTNIIIAYEPIWSINTGEVMPPEVLDKVIVSIRNIISSMGYNNYKLLYGGSVSSSNISNLIGLNIDGYLLGSSSADIEEIKKIINYTHNV